jgi:hypothetical protein
MHLPISLAGKGFKNYAISVYSAGILNLPALVKNRKKQKKALLKNGR